MEAAFVPTCGAAVSASAMHATGPDRSAAVTEAPDTMEAGPTWPPAGRENEPRFPPARHCWAAIESSAPSARAAWARCTGPTTCALHQQVALKFLPRDLLDDPDLLARLHQEVRIARQISHRLVCRVHDIAEVDGETFLTMEFIDGEDLRSLLKRIGRLPEDKGIEIAHQLCEGLAAVHEKGIVHRDLKPLNIMIDGRGQARLTDFGLAVIADAIPTADFLSGTPGYMAPEQLAGGKPTVQSDLFALGLVLYEIFTGRRAFPAKNREELVRLYDEQRPTAGRRPRAGTRSARRQSRPPLPGTRTVASPEVHP